MTQLRIAIITSSRAEYGILLPLIRKISAEYKYMLRIIAFGQHLSRKHGNTVDQIIADGYPNVFKVQTLFQGDSPEIVSLTMANTFQKFRRYWTNNRVVTDLIICVGDRYEMFAAVSSSAIYNIPIMHLHGGETTLGSLDNNFRNAITCFAKYHMVSCNAHKQRVIDIRKSHAHVHDVGAMSLDAIKTFTPLSTSEFLDKFGFVLNNPILVTFHPMDGDLELINSDMQNLIHALAKCKSQIVVTMPNTDQGNQLIRDFWRAFKEVKDNVHLVETLGTQGYFTVLQQCYCMVGNSSSGIIEAKSFGKYVINIGNRQAGRTRDNNVIDVSCNSELIYNNIWTVGVKEKLNTTNIFGSGNTADKIMEVLNEISANPVLK